MEHYGIFVMSNKRGVLGWTIMKYDGFCYWYPTNKWYSSHNVARKMRDKLNIQLKSKRA